MAVAFSGCVLITSADDLHVGAEEAIEAGAPTGPGGDEGGTSSGGPSEPDGAAPDDAGIDSGGGGGDAAVDASGGTTLPCAAGTTAVAPVLVVEHAAGSGFACDVGNALAVDGLVAGLDRPDDPDAFLAGVQVSGCLRYDFGAPVQLDRIVVRARASANACGRACRVDDGCGTNQYYELFTSDDGLSVEHVTTVSITRTLADYSRRAPASLRYVYVCRGSGGEHRDDVQVDGVWGCR